MSFLTPVLMSSITTTVAALLILGYFLVVEPRTRKGAAARSLESGAFDRGSTLAIGAAFGFSIMLLLLTLALNAFQLGPLPLRFGAWLGWVGVGLMLAGLALRLLAARTLGAFYTRTLVAAPGQPVVQRGPYRVVRHPGYLGDLILWIGAALATQNLVAIAGIPVVMIAVYAYRIRREEAMLNATLGDSYAAYVARTWGLIPWVY
jgi:protein-S-isoprenylcysteine O-methyltransferase Ste14